MPTRMDIGLTGWQFESGVLEPRPPAQLYAEFVEDAALADELNFAFILVSEHHFWYDGSCPAPLLALAAAAARTRQIHLGTGVLLLPLHDPLRVAEQTAMLDGVSGGRALLGVGLGYRDDEYDGFGVARRQRGGRMTEALEILRQAWTGGPLTFRGHFYRYDDAPVSVRPVRGTIPLWVGGHAPAAIDRAARAGAALLLPPILTHEQLLACRDRYRATGAAAGVDREQLRVGIHRIVWVDDSDARAERFMRPRLEHLYRETYAAWGRFTDAAGRPIGPDQPALLDAQVRATLDQAIWGSPDTVRRRLDQLVAQGLDFVGCKVQSGSVPQQPLRRCLTLLAREVLPGLTARGDDAA